MFAEKEMWNHISMDTLLAGIFARCNEVYAKTKRFFAFFRLCAVVNHAVFCRIVCLLLLSFGLCNSM